jgi:hypothetical protein
MKYPEMSWETMEAIVDKLGGMNGVRNLLGGTLTVSETARFWWEENDTIYFSVTSSGTTGPDWVDRLKRKGFEVTDHAKNMLCSKDFCPTSGVEAKIAVLKGMLFADGHRITSEIRAEAAKRKLVKPNVEVACLIRELLMHGELESMGLWGIVTMHEPIEDASGDMDLLRAVQMGARRLLGSCGGGNEEGWRLDNGFAFEVSKIGL